MLEHSEACFFEARPFGGLVELLSQPLLLAELQEGDDDTNEHEDDLNETQNQRRVHGGTLF